MLNAGYAMRCYVAHPPTMDDEVAATQRWFGRVPPPKRTHSFGRWRMAIRFSRTKRLRPLAGRLAQQSAVGKHEDWDAHDFEPVPGTPAWENRDS